MEDVLAVSTRPYDPRRLTDSRLEKSDSNRHGRGKAETGFESAMERTGIEPVTSFSPPTQAGAVTSRSLSATRRSRH